MVGLCRVAAVGDQDLATEIVVVILAMLEEAGTEGGTAQETESRGHVIMSLTSENRCGQVLRSQAV